MIPLKYTFNVIFDSEYEIYNGGYLLNDIISVGLSLFVYNNITARRITYKQFLDNLIQFVDINNISNLLFNTLLYSNIGNFNEQGISNAFLLMDFL